MTRTRVRENTTDACQAACRSVQVGDVLELVSHGTTVFGRSLMQIRRPGDGAVLGTLSFHYARAVYGYDRLQRQREELLELESQPCVVPDVRGIVLKKTGDEPPLKPHVGVNLALEIRDVATQRLQEDVEAATRRLQEHTRQMQVNVPLLFAPE
jgi:hypothetical protein